MIFLKAKRHGIFATIALIVAYCLPAAAQEQRRGSYTPPAAETIHAVVAEHGMVVAQEKIAARIGADVLRRGGNGVAPAGAPGFSLAVAFPPPGHICARGFLLSRL